MKAGVAGGPGGQPVPDLQARQARFWLRPARPRPSAMLRGLAQVRPEAGAARRGAKTGLGHGKGSLEAPCGWGCLVIRWCQRFNNVRCFLIFFCILVTAQGVVFGLVDLSTDSFKKENNLNIIENIFLSLTYDISSCLVVVFIAYYGGKGNIPRWITVSSFLVGSGSLLFAFPYFSVEDSQMKVEFEGIVEAVGILGYSLGYTIGAPLIKVSVLYENSTFEKRTGQLRNLTAPCNSHCKCSSAFYSATCGRNDIGYFSPCFAGCTQSKTLKAGKTYYNCSCIKEGLTTSDDQGDFIDATSGTCDPKCIKLPLFIAFIFSTIVFFAFAGVPSILTILRIVSDKQRPLAMGMTFVILRICGTLPGPVIFKIIRETSCIFRDTERCGSTGNCWIYYKTKMAYLLVAVSHIKLCVFFEILKFCLYSRKSAMGFPGGSEVKASAPNVGDPGLIPGSGRSPGEGNGNPLQYSCLENPMDGEAW
uniref:Kazal-like domain-containing protein n=1 Tax=Moschus moschiferus TaxID=68415 RepID=A0A8C6CF40_MOSMO